MSDGFQFSVQKPGSPFDTPIGAPVNSTAARSGLYDGASSAPILDGRCFPRQKYAEILTWSAEKRSQWDADRLRAKTDGLFMSELLGFDLQVEPHFFIFRRLPQITPGKSLSELSEKKRIQLLVSRQIGKTTCVRTYVCQLICAYPNIRIVYQTGSENLGKAQLRVIKGFFETPTPRFLELFPEMCIASSFEKKSGEWKDAPAELGTQTEFTTPCRTNHLQPEATFSLLTEKMASSGSHFDVGLLDDLVNNQNSSTPEALDKSYNSYKHMTPLVSVTGLILVVGTVYANDDAHMRMQDEAAAEEKKFGHSIWQVTQHGCYSKRCLNCPHGDHFHLTETNALGQGPCFHPDCQCAGFQDSGAIDVLCPRIVSKINDEPFGYTMQWLEEERARLGEDFFGFQYLCQPIVGAKAQFTEALIGAHTLFRLEQLPPSHKSTLYLVGDLAYSKDPKDRDLTVFLIAAKFSGQLFPFACYAGHWGANDQVDALIQAVLRHRPTTIYLEKNMGSDALGNLIKIKAEEKNIPSLPIIWIQGSNKKGAKEQRISNVHPWMVSNRLFLFAGMEHYETLVAQLLKPKSRRNDFADCLGLLIEAPTGAAAEIPPAQTQESVNSWLRRLHTPREDSGAYPDSGGGSGLACG